MIYSSYTDFIIINWSDSYIIRPCYYESCKDVRSFYFKETNQFAYICKQNNKFLIRLINNTNGEYNQNFICNKKITININCTDNSDYEGSFALIYNDSINYFNIITDYNFTSNQKCTFSYPEKKVIINNYTNNSNITEYDEIQEEETDKIMSISDFFEEEKFDNNITENKDENVNINMDPNYILENKNNIIKSIDVGETYEAQTENFKIIIKPTNITPLKNDTYIEFNECEKILREKYNMTNSSIITFFQLEIFNNDSSALINQIKYSVYDENKNELDLNLCSEVTTQIHHSLKNNSDINLSSISNFQNLGYDILNIKDKFYTDLCQSYSSSGNDMILADRIKILYKNYSLCEQGCVYKAIDLDYNNIVCECKIEGNTSTSTVFKPLMNEDEKDVSFLDSNIGVVKCYNLVFNLRNKKNNIGFIFFSCLFIIIIIFLGMFFKKGLSPVIDYLNKEMKKYGYDIEINLNIKNKSKNKGNPNKKIIKIKKKHSMINSLSIISKNSTINKIRNLLTTDKKIENISLKRRKTKTYDTINESNNYGIIKVDINNIKGYYPLDSNKTLYNYTFEEACKYDKRNIFQIFYIYLLSKQIIFHTFFNKSPLELFTLRFILFIFMLSCDLSLNALFYLNDNISKKYHYAKNLFLFTFSNNISIIIYSTLLSYLLITLLTKLTNSSNSIRQIFSNEEKKILKNKKYVK